MRGPRSAVTTAAVLVAALATVVPVGVTGQDLPVLVDVRAAHHRGFDRVVFEFEGGLPDATFVDWVDRVTHDGSGRRVAVQGNAFLQVSLQGVLGHELSQPMRSTYGPRSRAFDLPNVAHVVNAGDFEAVVSFGIGLLRETRILRTIQLRGPARFVIDVAAAFPTMPVGVAFVEGMRVPSAGASPHAALVPSDAVVLAQRSVPSADPVEGALVRLAAGPTADELAAGLRLERSHTTGFRDVRVSSRAVARVGLTGGCDGAGRPVTIADLIFATLKPLPEVEWVKILDRDGQTQRPWGASDSVPDCLAPVG